ncbi:GMC oxidoreductase [Sphingomonas sp. MMS24-JH45]
MIGAVRTVRDLVSARAGCSDPRRSAAGRGGGRRGCRDPRCLARHGTTAYHAAGTCRMDATQARWSIPKPACGVEGLHVVDLSIFPDIPAGTPSPPSWRSRGVRRTSSRRARRRDRLSPAPSCSRAGRSPEPGTAPPITLGSRLRGRTDLNPRWSGNGFRAGRNNRMGLPSRHRSRS